MAQFKSARDQEGFEAAERLRNMDLAIFFVWFWTPTVSDYLQDRIDAEKPLSDYYVRCKSRSVAKHAALYQPFKKTALREASLYLIETWLHHLKREGVFSNVFVDALGAIRTPLSWAGKRGLIDETFSLSGIVRLKEHYRKRGILNRTEVAKIMALPTPDIMMLRPRLKDGDHLEGTAPIDLRMKAVVLLS